MRLRTPAAVGEYVSTGPVRGRREFDQLLVGVHASRSGAANLFRAVLADGSRVEGMVFPGGLIWDDDAPPRANAELLRKRR